MSIAGKKSVHYIKKDISSQKTPALGFKSLRFAHKATLGDTVISLSSLTTPTEDFYSTFINPSLTELNAANLLYSKSNLILVSSLSGTLASSAYRVTGNLSIELLNPAEDGEIFEGIIVSMARSGVAIDEATKTRFQTKLLAADKSTTGVMTDLSYTLEVGKTYRIVFKPVVLHPGGGSTVNVEIKDGSTVIGKTWANDTGNVRLSNERTVIRTMVNAALTFEVVTISGGAVEGNSTLSETHATVEELPNHEVYGGW